MIVEIECKPRQKSRPALREMVVDGRSPKVTIDWLGCALGLLPVFI